MIPTNFEYVAPRTVDEAVSLIAELGDDCKVLAGGHSLIPAMKLRLTEIPTLVDIGRIPDLSYILIDGKTIRIGAMTTHHAIASSEAIRAHGLLLAECAGAIGDQQVRNRGTIGGSLVHADPAADWPAAVLALDGELILRSKKGERAVRATDFFVEMLTTDVRPGELLTEIRIAAPSQPAAASYKKVAQAASGFALVGIAVQLEVAGGKCAAARVAVNGLAPKSYRASEVEAVLNGAVIDEIVANAASQRVDEGISDVMEDLHASGDYRRHLARVYTKRAIIAAATGA